MSIINDALKKAGRPIIFRPAEIRKKGGVNWGPFFVLGVLLLIVSPIIAPAFHNPYRNEVVPMPGGHPAGLPARAEEPVAPTDSMNAQFAVEELPIAPTPSAPIEPPTPPEPTFLLNGLVYSKGGSYCLINGKVVKIGQSVEGATLTSVTADTAVLDYQGRKIILSSGS